MVRWHDVTPRRTCRICGRTKWCSYSTDGHLEICRHVAGDNATERRDKWGIPYWLYRADGAPAEAAELEPARLTPIAPPEVLHWAYGDLLAELELDDHHRADLHRRGLPDAEIRRQGFRSWPVDRRQRRALAARLYRQHGEAIRGVPGWGVGRDGRPDLMRGGAGLIIPVHDPAGRLASLRLRLDDPGDGGRYRWVSSRWASGPGPGWMLRYSFRPGAWRHPSEVRAETARVTEGELKAIVMADRTGVLTVSVPGVSAGPQAIPLLRLWGVRTVLLSYDTDWQTEPTVARHLLRTAQALRGAGLRLVVEDWRRNDAA